MNVLEVYSNFFPSVGGVQRHMNELCKCLVKRGHQPVVTAWVPSEPSSEIMDGIVVYRFKMPFLLYVIRYIGMLYLFFWIIRLVRRYNIDLLHAHSYTLGIICALAGKVLHKPVVVTFHTYILGTAWLSPLMSLVEYVLKKFFICSTTAIICVSKSVCREMVRLGFPNSNLKLIYNWVPELPRCEIKNFRSTLQKFNLEEKKFVLFVGRLVESKGFAMLIYAFKSLIDKGYALDLVIAGGGTGLKKFQKLSRRLGIANRLHFLNECADQDLACLYKGCEIVVLPSIFEGFGLTLLEAMSFGKPVVATKVGGIPEVVEDGYNGILVEPNSGALALGMEKLLSTPKLRNIFVQRSEEIVDKKFSKRNCYATVKFLEICASL